MAITMKHVAIFQCDHVGHDGTGCTETATFEEGAEESSLEQFGTHAGEWARGNGWNLFGGVRCPTHAIRTIVEIRASEIKVGDTIIAQKKPRRRYKVIEIMPGMGGPYLTMTGPDGKEVEHDTSFDSYSATYSVDR